MEGLVELREREREKREYSERERAEVVVAEMALGEILVGTIVGLGDLVQNGLHGGVLRGEQLGVRQRERESTARMLRAWTRTSTSMSFALSSKT